jgi:hypothetical protein
MFAVASSLCVFQINPSMLNKQLGQGDLAEEEGISAVARVNSISSDASSYSLWSLNLENCVGSPGICSLSSAAGEIYTGQRKCFKFRRIPRKIRN